MILIDVDHFKTYNDTFGHPIGDEVLAAVARAIAMSLRGKEDFVARYGGEEFVIILPDCGSADASQIAERVREEIRCLGIIHPGSPLGVLTISAGVASLVAAPHAARAVADRGGRRRALHRQAQRARPRVGQRRDRRAPCPAETPRADQPRAQVRSVATTCLSDGARPYSSMPTR